MRRGALALALLAALTLGAVVLVRTAAGEWQSAVAREITIQVRPSAERNVEAQRDDPASLLHLYRLLIEARKVLGEGFQLLKGFEGIVAFERPEHVIAINVTD